MRITPHRQTQLGLLRSDSQTSRLAELRDQITSGVRISKPSDDPNGQRQVLNSQATSSLFESQAIAISDVRALLSESNAQLRSIQQFTVNARDIGLGSRSINNQAEADVLADEIDSLLNAIGDAANTKYNGHFLFSGANTNVLPYEDLNSETNYQGVATAGTTELAGAGRFKTFYAGSDIFTSGAGGTTHIVGDTGAVAAVGTASGHGTSELIVLNTGTSYLGTSGVQPGISTADDTVIAQIGTFKLQIEDTAGDGSAGFVSLNNGQRIPFTSADTDLQITGPLDHVVHLDMSAISAGFNGEIDVLASGSMSLDGGATSTPITFAEVETLVDSQGNVRHLNTQGITRPGRDTVQLTGNSDLFETLRTFRDDLLNYDDFNASEWDETVTEYLAEAELMADHMLDVVGEQSVDLQALDRIEERGDAIKFEADSRLAEINGTDFVAAATELAETQNLTEYTYATLAGVFQVSILDYL